MIVVPKGDRRLVGDLIDEPGLVQLVESGFQGEELVERRAQRIEVAYSGLVTPRNRSGAMNRRVPTTSRDCDSSSLSTSLARPKSVTQTFP
jgi:hypothetical protein